MKDNSKVVKVLAIATVASMLILSNVTWVFWNFWRAASQSILNTWILSTSYDYWYGFGDGKNGDINGWWYGYGYWYSATWSMFSDIDNSFAKSYIETLASKWIVKGYDDGTFRPQNNASRVEFLKMTLLSAWIDYSNVDTSKLTFADVVKTSWEAKVIAKASELGYVDTKNVNFRPTDTITRAESIKLVIKSFWFNFTNYPNTTPFSDVTVDWTKKYINMALDINIISKNNTTFRPNDSITRAEVTKIITKSLLWISNPIIG